MTTDDVENPTGASLARQHPSARRMPSVLYVSSVPYTLRFLRPHYRHLKQQGFRIGIVASPEQELGDIAAADEVVAHPISIAREINPTQDLGSLFRLIRLFRRERPDIVHSVSPKGGLLGSLAARLTGVPVVAVSQFGLRQMTLRGTKKRLLNVMTRLACRCSDWVWADSASLRDYIVQNRLCAAEKLVVLGAGSAGGVDAEAVFSPARFSADDKRRMREQLRIPPGSRTLGFVGRVTRDKGIKELAEAWQMLRDKYPDLHLLIVGPLEPNDPPPAETMSILTSDSRVRFAGMQPDIPAYLSLMDLFVNPSYREGFGVANLEASAMGIPVVSTRIPGCVDSVVDGVTGTLVDCHDGAQLAAAIARYLDDLPFHMQHGSAGRERVLSAYAPEKFWRELEASYWSLLRQVDPAWNFRETPNSPR